MGQKGVHGTIREERGPKQVPNFKTRPGEVRSSLKVGTFFPPLRAVVQSIPETALRWCRSFLQLSVGASTLSRKSFRGNDIFVCVCQYVRPQGEAGGFFNSILDNSAQELLIPTYFHIVIFLKNPKTFVSWQSACLRSGYMLLIEQARTQNGRSRIAAASWNFKRYCPPSLLRNRGEAGFFF